MINRNTPSEKLSPWWRKSVIIVLVIGFGVLIWMAISAHKDAPPIPEKVVGPSGETIFAREDILSGLSREISFAPGICSSPSSG